MGALGDFLKKSRESAGYSQKQVAKEIGITDSRLSRIERGINFCPATELRKLADLYKVSVIDLYIKAGYLTQNDLTAFQTVFRGVSELDDDERKFIQQGIDLLIRKKVPL